ncbi:hypothetical protein Gotri_011741 [Gossypium trilobum]|uniref:Kinesin-like protein n=1 Tax=Gossypium trilobum TaxID=34281 RepID=A0A7J9EUS7_9ROSI|nr:hypothetical protein [Gossypium trilobum]
MIGTPNNGRLRLAFSLVNGSQDLGPDSTPVSHAGSECGAIEFTREDVEALVSEKMKSKNKFNYKERCENMMEYIKRLRLCIRWFQELEGEYAFEQEKLRSALELIERRCYEMEMALKNKDEEMNLIILELRNSLASLQEQLVKEESEKKAAMDSLVKEKEARDSIERSKASLSEELDKVRAELDSANQRASQDGVMKQKDALLNEVACLRMELHQIKDDRDQYQQQAQSLAVEASKYKELATNSSGLEEKCLSQGNQIQILHDQLAVAERKLQMSDTFALEKRKEFEGQKEIIEELHKCLEDAEFKLIEGEKLRKKLHNTILELKGNIRVFCRVRPQLADDSSSNHGKVFSYPTVMEYLDRSIDMTHNGQKHSFIFDKVFMPDVSQEEVFVEISQLVQSALDGYKVCIFAYGQTGSGKTYTMMGKPGQPDEKGLIPRSLEQIFQTIQALQHQGWRYQMQVSMLEIYNETIRDLLSTNRDSSRFENGVTGKQYMIKHDANGNTQVSDLTIVDVQSSREVSFLLDRAAQSRSVGRTQMNEQSSRSHFVFTMRITGVNESTEQQVQGVLNLIDLAGSERLSKSGSTGDRLKETQAINKSLSSLADVIFALAKKEDHVPFRNSKLTYLLQPCLGGDSKTLMFVNLSPEPSSAGESLCSLRFAARVNACEIGTPRRQLNIRTSNSRLSYG